MTVGSTDDIGFFEIMNLIASSIMLRSFLSAMGEASSTFFNDAL